MLANFNFSVFKVNVGVIMRIQKYSMLAFKAKKTDLNFVNKIRDIDVTKLELLQKSKIDVLLKLREAKKVVEKYKYFIKDLLDNNLQKHIISAKSDLAEMESYVQILQEKLHEINLKILEEEEKNY